MTQLAPTTMIQAQAVSMIRDLQKRYVNKDTKQPDDIARELKTALTAFLTQIGRPMFNFDEFVLGEPVLSEKMNRIQKMIQDDINILADQTTFLQAGTIFMFNYVNTEILKAQNENAQASNKLKTLQLYSSSTDPDVIVFGDQFLNDESLDLTKMPIDKRAIIQFPGFLTLDKTTSNSNKLLKNAVVTILNSSNGFLGNNQEADQKSVNSGFEVPIQLDGVTPTPGDITFVAQTDRHALVKHTVDQDPTSWIEYEYCLVSEADRAKAKGYNFTYRKPDPEDDSKEVVVDWATGPGYTVATKDEGTLDGFKYVPGPDAGVLKLDLQIDMLELTKINSITLMPFPMQDNKNSPILVSKVETSEDSSTWVGIQPTDMWIANDKNLNTARIADNSIVGNGVWVFPERVARYIRFQIRQKNPIPVKLGHIYWETKPSKVTVSAATETRDGVGITSGPIVTDVPGQRREGPVPSISNPVQYNDPKYSVVGNLIKKVELLDGKRWAIGIRDISVDQVGYKTTGIIISKPFKINGVVDRVSLEADVEIPESFPSDSGELWVKFFVSPDDGINWFPISRVQDDYLGIPEIIAFNDPLPAEYHEVGVGYESVATAVNSVRVKIELSRPANSTTTSANTAADESLTASSSPVVKSYKLKVRQR